MRKIGIIILLVLCLTLLLLTGCITNTIIPETTIGNLGNQEDTEEPIIVDTEEPIIVDTEEPIIVDTEEPVSKWSGLEMVLISDNPYVSSNEEYDIWVNTLLENGFEELRECPTYQNTVWLASSKASIIRNVGKGAKYIWGVSSYNLGNTAYTITAENWATFRQAILDNAQWAQDNGVYEFQLGNEEELHIDETTMTVEKLVANLKSVATEVQEIFTNGNVSYTCGITYSNTWINAGRGDIDIIASNIYLQDNGVPWEWWEGAINALVAGFGADHTYLTEFSLDTTGVQTYSEDEEVQATAINNMLNGIKASGMTRAFYHLWYHPDIQFGVLKADGTYRLLWNSLLGSG